MTHRSVINTRLTSSIDNNERKNHCQCPALESRLCTSQEMPTYDHTSENVPLLDGASSIVTVSRRPGWRAEDTEQYRKSTVRGVMQTGEQRWRVR